MPYFSVRVYLHLILSPCRQRRLLSNWFHFRIFRPRFNPSVNGTLRDESAQRLFLSTLGLMNHPMLDRSTVSHYREKFGWPLFWVLWFGVPWLFGWFFVSRVACTSCFGDVLLHCLAFFGYVVLGGFIYSLSKPWKGRQSEAQLVAQPSGYMLGTREEVLLTFVLFGGIFAVTWFFNIYEL